MPFDFEGQQEAFKNWALENVGPDPEKWNETVKSLSGVGRGGWWWRHGADVGFVLTVGIPLSAILLAAAAGKLLELIGK